MREGSKEPYIGEHLFAEGGQYRHRYQLFFVHALQSSVVSTRSTAVQVGSHFKSKQSTLALRMLNREWVRFTVVSCELQ